MKILILGNKGQLGQDMSLICVERGLSVVGMDYPEIDICQKENLQKTIESIGPDTIINCAAFAAVDLCEEEKEKAYNVNALGVENIALAARNIKAKVVHFSTDYIFDGEKNTPYIESDVPNPVSVYGKSKFEGEQRLERVLPEYYILRIAWLYGAKGNNFVKKILEVAKKKVETKEVLKVVDDQRGTPTWTKDVCRQTLELLFAKAPYGIYHSTNEGECTWFDFASLILETYRVFARIERCTTLEFPRPAHRPRYSVLENQKLKQQKLNIMPDWKESFHCYVKEC